MSPRLSEFIHGAICLLGAVAFGSFATSCRVEKPLKIVSTNPTERVGCINISGGITVEIPYILTNWISTNWAAYIERVPIPPDGKHFGEHQPFNLVTNYTMAIGPITNPIVLVTFQTQSSTYYGTKF